MTEQRLTDLEHIAREHTDMFARITTVLERATIIQDNQQRAIEEHTQVLNVHTDLLRELIRLVGSIDDRLTRIEERVGQIEQILRERGHHNGSSAT